jgi:hypothetical protein
MKMRRSSGAAIVPGRRTAALTASTFWLPCVCTMRSRARSPSGARGTMHVANTASSFMARTSTLRYAHAAAIESVHLGLMARSDPRHLPDHEPHHLHEAQRPRLIHT